MANRKTLIAYDTKGGAAEETAQKIAETLRSKYQLEVDVVDLRRQKRPDISQYDNIVIGSGVRFAKVYENALRFLENNFGNRQVAFYVCSSEAGTPETYQTAKVKFVENVLNNYPNVKAISTEAFGGRAKMLGKTLVDNLDIAKIAVWAEEIGKQFMQ
jgi:menaquinone-dependent protoporphyrinogen oxidase